MELLHPTRSPASEAPVAATRRAPTVFLDDPEAVDPAATGETAATLAELAQAGLAVPAGFVVTVDALHRCLDAGAVGDELQVTEAGVDPDDAVALQRCSARLTSLVRSTVLTPTVRMAVLDAYQHLSVLVGGGGGPVPVAVRSSVPDASAQASFAGVTRSTTNVLGAADLLRRIVDCWTANVSAGAIAYRRRLGCGRPTDLAVLVQSMVMSERSAVACSVDPVTGRPGEILVEAARGLGLVVVDGSVTPDRYVVGRAEGAVLSATPGRQDHLITAARGCSNRRTGVAVASRRPVLRTTEILSIVDTVVRIEQARGGAHVVEVGLDGHGRHFVLHARRLADRTGPLPPAPTRGDPSGSSSAADAGVVGRGLAASAGVGSGPVRILVGPGAADQLRPGEVLVVPTADPAWSSVLDRAAAVVSDRGGALSNLALLCRERGVPAVLGAPEATAVLGPLGLVTVDGGRGTVSQPSGARSADGSAAPAGGRGGTMTTDGRNR